MARFGVYRNPDGQGYLLELQANLLSNLNTRVVVPLLPVATAPMPAGTLNPIFEIEGGRVSMVTQFMAAVPASILKDTLLTLDAQHDEITAAIDFLFQGF